MFPQRDRISRELFPQALKGRRISSSNFTIIVPNEATLEKRYAVVVSKKVARLSVTRHLLKRRVTAALHSLVLPRSLIVFPRAGAASIDFKSVKEELDKLLSNFRR